MKGIIISLDIIKNISIKALSQVYTDVVIIHGMFYIL